MKKLVLILFLANTAFSQVFVNNSATGSNNGSSWANAYTDLQDALTNAHANDTIWVAAGTYIPTTTTNRDISFVIPDSVKVYGGFAGNESAGFDLNLRNFEANKTILSGDIGTLNVTTDNSFHVVRTNYVSPYTEVNGFTITSGNADDGNVSIPQVLGGGFFNNAEGTGNTSSPRVVNCIFKDNYAISGGGFYNFGKQGIAKATIINCQFISNSSRSGGGILNNGQNGGEATAIVINSKFYKNTAEWDGGGVMNFSSNASFNNSKYINCTFSNNIAQLDGNDMYNQETSGGTTDIELANSIFYQSPFAKSVEYEGSVNFNISNCLTNLSTCVSFGFFSTYDQGCSNILFDTNFEFIDEPNGDLRTRYNSSARNAGLNSKNLLTYDLIGRPRILKDTIDIGAYEGLDEIFVNPNSTLTKNGTSWNNGLKDLQPALKEAQKVWVAKGTYYPTTSVDRFERFVLDPGMELYGGFAGNEDVNTYNLSQRNLVQNETVLSGNIGNINDSTDNSYRILNITSSDTEQAKIDGFTISGGQAGGTPQNSNIQITGAGCYLGANSLVLNCKFKNNYSFYRGGAILTAISGSTGNSIIENCTFINNSSSSGAAIYGDINTSSLIRKCSFVSNSGSLGSVYIDASYSMGTEIDNCHFEGNMMSAGSAIAVSSNAGVSQTLIKNSTFSQNNATGNGGAIFIQSSSTATLNVQIINSLFERNTASNGGAINVLTSTSSYSKLFLDNSSFVSNQALTDGGAIFDSGTSTAQFQGYYNNTIFWNNTAGGSTNSWTSNSNAISQISLSHSIVEEPNCNQLDQTTCTAGNLFNVNPFFENMSTYDYRLSSASPARNAGVNDSVSVTKDLVGNTRIKGGVVDMGPYETAGTLFVNHASNSGNNDGSTWTNAFVDLQDALKGSVQNDTIWVAKGSYYPTNTTDQNISFIVPNNVKLYGGLSGLEPTSFDLDLRDFVANETILSANIGNPSSNNDNSLSIIKMRNVSPETTLDGFTLTSAIETAFIIDGSNGGSSSPVLQNCKFIFNKGSLGGAILNTGKNSGIANPIIKRCRFSFNNSEWGGAILNDASNSGIAKPIIENCIFNTNLADFASSIFNYNFNNGNASPAITNCTFYDNTNYSGRPNDIWTFTYSANQDTIFIRNSIFWNSLNPSNAILSGSHFYIDNSLINLDSCEAFAPGSGSVTCGSNMVYNQDPLFVDPTNSNFQLQTNSPAIDLGTRAIDFAYDINGKRHVNKPDAGAHEFPCSIIQNITSVPSITNEINSQAAVQTLQANNTINPTSNVYYQAGNNILLSPGFEVKSGNVFEAEIDDGCL